MLPRRVGLLATSVVLALTHSHTMSARREHGTTPTPRNMTRWWLAAHERLAAEAAAWRAPLAASLATDGVSGVVLLGDSITERLHLTGAGEPLRAEHPLRLGGLAELIQGFRRWGAPLILAISGDGAQNLLWRLQHGELPSHLREERALVFALHIGTNNLGRNGMSAAEAAEAVLHLTEYLAQTTKGRILLTEVLPRSELEKVSWRARPAQSAREAVDELNRRLRGRLGGGADGHVRRYSRVRLASCSEQFDVRGSAPFASRDAANRSLLPDGLHPTVAGYALLLRCWEREIAALAARSRDGRRPRRR